MLCLWLLLKYVSVEQAVIALGDVPVVPECSAAQVKRLLSLERVEMATQLSSHTRRNHFTLHRIYSCSVTALPDGYADPLVASRTSLWD